MSNSLATQSPESFMQSNVIPFSAKKETYCIFNWRKECNLTYKREQTPEKCSECTQNEMTSYWQCSLTNCERIVCANCKQTEEIQAINEPEEEMERNVSDYIASDGETDSEYESNHNSKKRKKLFKNNSNKKRRKISDGESYDKAYKKVMREMNKLKSVADESVLNYQQEIEALNAEKKDLIRSNELLQKKLENNEKKNLEQTQLLLIKNEQLSNMQNNMNEWKDKYEKMETCKNDLENSNVNLQTVINMLKEKLSETETTNNELIERCSDAYQTIENEKNEWEKQMKELKDKNNEYETQKRALEESYNPFQAQLQKFLNDK